MNFNKTDTTGIDRLDYFTTSFHYSLKAESRLQTPSLCSSIQLSTYLCWFLDYTKKSPHEKISILTETEGFYFSAKTKNKGSTL